MELVRYDEEKKEWVKDTNNSSYNYVAGTGTDNTSSHWANAKVTIDGVESFFVWIPRYAYKITPKEEGQDAGSIDVVFLQGTGYTYIDEDGNEQTAVRADKDGDPTKEYVVHPAFTNDVDNGGWDDELAGLWIGKYETSLYDKETKQNINTSSETEGNILLTEETNKNKVIAVQPNMSSWRYCTIGNMYTNARNYSPNLESHMLKNSEWGAVAYLTYSQYGRNGHEISINNNSNFITGIGSGSTSASSTDAITNTYDTANGMTASSTGNIYGIYDLSGGAYEYVASYYNGSTSNNLTNNGSSFATKDGKSDEYSTAYEKDKDKEAEAYKKGDATYETSGWNSDYANFVDSDSPFFLRGGSYNNSSDTGVFCYFDYDGGANYFSRSFRVCLAVM